MDLELILKYIILFINSIHPRFKHDVASRLVTSALAVAYNESNVDFQGPYPSKFVHDATHHTLTVTYNGGRKPIEVRTNTGFDVCI